MAVPFTDEQLEWPEQYWLHPPPRQHSHTTAPSQSHFIMPQCCQPAVASVPEKLRKRIQALEFVEMVELLPVSWHADQAQAESCCRQGCWQPRWATVSNILVWLECFSSMVAILSAPYPTCVGSCKWSSKPAGIMRNQYGWHMTEFITVGQPHARPGLTWCYTYRTGPPDSEVLLMLQ